jgi:hypothetical protein
MCIISHAINTQAIIPCDMFSIRTPTLGAVCSKFYPTCLSIYKRKLSINPKHLIGDTFLSGTNMNSIAQKQERHPLVYDANSPDISSLETYSAERGPAPFLACG